MKHKSIQDALQYVAEHPGSSTEGTVDTPVWQLVCRSLVEIATSPDAKVRGSMARATRAQRILYDRMVGRRRAGTHPAQAKNETVEFIDLTQGVLE